MDAPFSSISVTGVGTGGGAVDLTAAIGMITNAPPPGIAGVLERTPATRTGIAACCAWYVASETTPWPRSASACGDARTGCGAPARVGTASSPACTGGDPWE